MMLHKFRNCKTKVSSRPSAIQAPVRHMRNAPTKMINNRQSHSLIQNVGGASRGVHIQSRSLALQKSPSMVVQRPKIMNRSQNQLMSKTHQNINSTRRTFAARPWGREATPAEKSKALRQLITSPELTFIMEAHNGLSARIVEETGFQGIWGSGLSISAQLGVRDSNEASWTQVVDVMQFMSDNTNIPILLDGDTGYGNFNNARRLVRKLEQTGVAGVCIEDKLFPKTNSLLDSRAQPLASISEFSSKIQCMKDTQRDPNFSVVARVEALIAGWPMDEALKRADAYRKAGADAILMHSKRKDSAQIEEFMRKWENRGPVVIVPTNYYETPTEKFREWGVSMIIWANHNLRASVQAMQGVSAQIFKDQSLINVEKNIAPVKEIFRLQNEDELKEAESKYLPQE